MFCINSLLKRYITAIIILLLSHLCFPANAQFSDTSLSIEGNLLSDGIARIYTIKFLKEDVIIKKESFPVLDSIAKLLLQNPSLRVEVSSHSETTDSSGLKYDKMIIDMEFKKAKAVCNYLMFKGVSEPRLICKGYKSTISKPEPVESIINDTLQLTSDTTGFQNDSIPVPNESNQTQKLPETIITPRIEFRIISR